MSWKDDAVRMRLDENRPWREIAEALHANFPDKDIHQAIGKVRVAVKESKRWQEEKAKKAAPNPEPEQAEQSEQTNYKSTNGWKNGVFESDDLIRMCQEDGKSPRRMLELHGLDPDEWEVVSCRNNLWHGQTHHNFRAAEGPRTLLYQSRLTAKPIGDKLTLKDIDNYFAARTFAKHKPLTAPLQYDPDGEILEIDLPDLHSGMLAWGKETGAPYDLKIARERFMYCISDVLGRCAGRKFRKIIFVTLGDLIHVDNNANTTTKGTPQQADGRIDKIFDMTLDMLIDAVTLMGGIAPTEVIHIKGNHDGDSGHMLIKGVEAPFKKDPNITFDCGPDPMKHRMIGCTLVGFMHGDMPRKNRIGWIQVQARKLPHVVPFVEVHHGHDHTQKTGEYIQTEDCEGVVARGLPKISNSSHWEHQQGYVSTESMMCFVWSETLGIREMWFSNL